jgi:D-alanine-D-alanine ligase
MGRLRVVVLTGGCSAEREVCLKSGTKVMAALDPARYEAVAVDLAAITGARADDLAAALLAPNGCDPKALSAPLTAAQPTGRGHPALLAGTPSRPTALRAAAEDRLATEPGRRPDVVFLALHGGAGENGSVQGMLELLGIPYTGSGVLASALAMNKIMSKKVFEREGIPTPKWVAVHNSGRGSARDSVLSQVGVPCVVKPACEGSTIGVTIVRERDRLEAALDEAFRYGREALAEEFVPGTEITGAVLGNEKPQVLPLVEIVPVGGFYDYERKYTPGATEEIIPARITEAQAARARELTLQAHQALGCRGFSRVDIIVGADEIYVLEVNSIPGLTETSLVPRAAAAAGISFTQLVDRLVELALEDSRREPE